MNRPSFNLTKKIDSFHSLNLNLTQKFDSYHKNIYSKWLEQNRPPASQKPLKSLEGHLQV